MTLEYEISLGILRWMKVYGRNRNFLTLSATILTSKSNFKQAIMTDEIETRLVSTAANVITNKTPVMF